MCQNLFCLGEILVIQSRENLSTLAVNGLASTHLQGVLYVSFRECLCFFSEIWTMFFWPSCSKKPWVVGKTISCQKVWIIFVKNLSGNLFRQNPYNPLRSFIPKEYQTHFGCLQIMSVSLDSFDENLKQLKTYVNLQFHMVLKSTRSPERNPRSSRSLCFSNFNLLHRKSEDKRDSQNTQKGYIVSRSKFRITFGNGMGPGVFPRVCGGVAVKSPIKKRKYL